MKPTNLSIRNSRTARSGLQEMCDYIKGFLTGGTITVVEIGAFSGDSGRIFAKNFDHVYSIDPWKSNYDPTGVDLASNPDYYNMNEVEACFNTMVQEMGNVTKMKMTSEEAVEIFSDGSINVIYIDAWHTYQGVRSDIEMWISKIKRPGVICGHDYVSRHHPGVKQAVDEYFYNSPIDRMFPDSSWLKRIG